MVSNNKTMRRLPQWKSYISAALLVMAALADCTSGRRSGAAEKGSILPAAYLNVALDSIRSHAMAASTVNWTEVTAEAQRRAAHVKSKPALYPIIRYVLSELRDNHSFLQLSDELRAAERRATGQAPENDVPAEKIAHKPSPYGVRMKSKAVLLRQGTAGIGFVFMPQGRRDDAFATAFQHLIADLLEQSPCAWIVDLRGNGGGDMWPMLAGLGPLLGEGELGRFVGGPDQEGSWSYLNGKAVLRQRGKERVLSAISGKSVPPIPASTPVAVLTDRGTASSGEAMVVAFRSRPNTRLFGEPTYGASTATEGFLLPDGANLVLAVSTFGDTKGRTYGTSILPDEPVAIGDRLVEYPADPVLGAALRWLISQAPCAANRH